MVLRIKHNIKHGDTDMQEMRFLQTGNMKVFILASGHPHGTNPLLGIFEWDQALALKKIGLEVVFLVLDLRSCRHKRKLGLRKSNQDGIDIIELHLPLGRIPSSFFFRVGRIAFSILYRVAFGVHGKPSLVHAHFTGMATMALATTSKKSIPLVITEHSSEVLKAQLPPAKISYYRNTYHRASSVIAVSKALAFSIHDHFGRSSHVIPNIVDLRLFSHTPKDVEDNGAIRFVSCGNLTHNKGHDTTIRAFAKFQASNPDSTLRIFGGGDIQEELQILIDSLHCSKSITLEGYASRSEIAEVYKKSDFFVLASRAETFGVVYIEAMASGLPVIATRCGGPEDFVSDSNGTLVPVDDEGALVNAMQLLVNREQDYNRMEISEEVKKQYSAVMIAEKIVDVYQTVLKKEG